MDEENGEKSCDYSLKKYLDTKHMYAQNEIWDVEW